MKEDKHIFRGLGITGMKGRDQATKAGDSVGSALADSSVEGAEREGRVERAAKQAQGHG